MSDDELVRAVISTLGDAEGFRSTVYQDERGYWTLGKGRCVDARVPGAGITEAEADYLAVGPVRAVIAGLDHRLPWWRQLTGRQQEALVEMGYNLGLDGLFGFKRMLAALKAGNGVQAAAEARSSLWYQQVKARRGDRIATMLTGS